VLALTQDEASIFLCGGDKPCHGGGGASRQNKICDEGRAVRCSGGVRRTEKGIRRQGIQRREQCPSPVVGVRVEHRVPAFTSEMIIISILAFAFLGGGNKLPPKKVSRSLLFNFGAPAVEYLAWLPLSSQCYKLHLTRPFINSSPCHGSNERGPRA
jgi:hypothetical protein